MIMIMVVTIRHYDDDENITMMILVVIMRIMMMVMRMIKTCMTSKQEAKTSGETETCFFCQSSMSI